jgi:hypothetical protein
MALAPAIAFLALHGLQNGFSVGEKTALAVLWMVPGVARGIADYTLLPVGVWAMVAVLFIVVRSIAEPALPRPMTQVRTTSQSPSL